MLVLKQQKCIRSLQERLIEEQTTNFVLKRQGGGNPDRDASKDVSQTGPSTGQDHLTEKSDQGAQVSGTISCLSASSVGDLLVFVWRSGIILARQGTWHICRRSDNGVRISFQGNSATDANQAENSCGSEQGASEQSECKTGQGASGSPTCGRIRVEDMAKLQDVLYCDHANFAFDQSRNPEIAAMQVYGIGGKLFSRIYSHEIMHTFLPQSSFSAYL